MNYFFLYIDKYNENYLILKEFPESITAVLWGFLKFKKIRALLQYSTSTFLNKTLLFHWAHALYSNLVIYHRKIPFFLLYLFSNTKYIYIGTLVFFIQRVKVKLTPVCSYIYTGINIYYKMCVCVFNNHQTMKSVRVKLEKNVVKPVGEEKSKGEKKKKKNELSKKCLSKSFTQSFPNSNVKKYAFRLNKAIQRKQ